MTGKNALQLVLVVEANMAVSFNRHQLVDVVLMIAAMSHRVCNEDSSTWLKEQMKRIKRIIKQRKVMQCMAGYDQIK